MAVWLWSHWSLWATVRSQKKINAPFLLLLPYLSLLIQSRLKGGFGLRTHPHAPPTHTQRRERGEPFCQCACFVWFRMWNGFIERERCLICVYEKSSYIWLWPKCPHYRSVVWMKYVYHRCCTPTVGIYKPIVPRTNKLVKLQAQNSTKNPLPV